MVILTPQLIAGLIGKMYIQLSIMDDINLKYMAGYMDVLFHYESTLKTFVIIQPKLKEVPLRKNLFSLKLKQYNENLISESSDYDRGQVDANNFLYYHVLNCYK